MKYIRFDNKETLKLQLVQLQTTCKNKTENKSFAKYQFWDTHGDAKRAQGTASALFDEPAGRPGEPSKLSTCGLFNIFIIINLKWF